MMEEEEEDRAGVGLRRHVPRHVVCLSPQLSLSLGARFVTRVLTLFAHVSRLSVPPAVQAERSSGYEYKHK